MKKMSKCQSYLVFAGLILCFCILMIFGTSSRSIRSDSPKLRFVSMVFRHGDRILDQKIGESYPNDPYWNYSTFPDGYGQLTLDGKKRVYELGRLLRKKYDHFLGDMYYHPHVYARSTASMRCKASLQLLLAGLYPPAGVQKWNVKLAWQPVNVIYTSMYRDGLLFPIKCSTYQKIYSHMLKSDTEVKKRIEQFSDLMEWVSGHTGKKITNMLDFFLLYHTLKTESTMNLTLPGWTHGLFPKGRLLEAALTQLELFSYNDELKRLNGGTLLYRLKTDMSNVINGTLTNKKINIFSAHDVTVAALLLALNTYDKNMPAYTSGVVVELLELNDEYFVRVQHYLGIPFKIVEITIPGCEILCPYNKFVALTSAVTATEQDRTCPIDTDEDLKEPFNI